MRQAEQVQAIGEAFAPGLQRILGQKLVNATIYGAAAFPDTLPTGDVDFHVILRSALAEGERAALQTLHDDLARRFPPLGAEMDGYYILLADARRREPPRSQMWQRAVDKAWALHRAHIHGGRIILLHGPDPRDIVPLAAWPELETALRGELDYVRRHLQVYPDYCILNLCRLMVSFETGDVVISKAAAARWAHERLPPWRPLVDFARQSYAGQGTAEARALMLAQVEGFFDFAVARIEEAARDQAPDTTAPA